MSSLSGYLMSLICAAFLCALLHCVAGKGTRRLTTGIFLALTALAPLGEPELPELDMDRFRAEAAAAVGEGTERAREMRGEIISEACKAYIWNKAAEMGLELTVSLELDEDGMPVSVILTGAGSPLERQELTDAIVRELGLGREDVTWNDSYQSSA